MTCVLRTGHRTWGGQKDNEGHRTYNIEFIVECDVTDGPANIMQTPGLPIPGSTWAFKGDVDLWAFCLPDMQVDSMGKEGESTFLWKVKQTFTTKAPKRQRCQDTKIEDPLMEPPQISGSDNNYTEEATMDRWGRAILTSSHEPIRGPQVEFDENRGVIKIVQNISSYFFAVTMPESMKNCLNDRPLWGFAARCIKLSRAPWERKYYGGCNVYFTRTLEFETDVKTFDREVLDEGAKALNGQFNSDGFWELIDIDGESPDPNNPAHYNQFKDRNGENCRVVLNGQGLPALNPNVVRRPNLQAQVLGLAPLYTRGMKVTVGANEYVALFDNNNKRPVPTPVRTREWCQLTGVSYNTYDDTGATTYNRGDILRQPFIGGFGQGGAWNPNQGGFEDYVCLRLTFGAFDAERWHHLGVEAPLGNALRDMGDWVGAQGDSNEYTAIGSDAAYDGQPTEPGSIFVSKYGEANFLTLGIPVSLEI